MNRNFRFPTLRILRSGTDARGRELRHSENKAHHRACALEHLKTDNPSWDLRAKALLAAAYCMMARRAELVVLRVEDLSFNADTGDGVALIRGWNDPKKMPRSTRES